jgi:tRNA(Ile)-lysidine synthetase-like protein
MEVNVKPGKYVVAVSGGVDSMVLLNMLAYRPELQLVVAHFEHGMRLDSDQDRQLVADIAGQYELPFVFARGNLGSGASEAVARTARYTFLRQTRGEYGADAIITAHHQDDVIETALINLLRGTHSRGLSSLRSTPELVRPLLAVPKRQLQEYATAHGLRWHEDSTNADERYVRNYLRHNVVPRLSAAERQQLLHHIETARRLHDTIDAELMPYVRTLELGRDWFIQLPYAVSAEAMALWLRSHGAAFDRKAIHRLVVSAKTATPGKRADVDATYYIYVSKNHITLVSR